MTRLVRRIDVGGGIRIASDGTYSSEYGYAIVLDRLEKELARIEYRKAVIEEFRRAVQRGGAK